MQTMCYSLARLNLVVNEYGRIKADFDMNSKLFAEVKQNSYVLMSHSDCVTELPKGLST